MKTLYETGFLLLCFAGFFFLLALYSCNEGPDKGSYFPKYEPPLPKFERKTLNSPMNVPCLDICHCAASGKCVDLCLPPDAVKAHLRNHADKLRRCFK